MSKVIHVVAENFDGPSAQIFTIEASEIHSSLESAIALSCYVELQFGITRVLNSQPSQPTAHVKEVL